MFFKNLRFRGLNQSNRKVVKVGVKRILHTFLSNTLYQKVYGSDVCFIIVILFVCSFLGSERSQESPFRKEKLIHGKRIDFNFKRIITYSRYSGRYLHITILFSFYLLCYILSK